MKTMINKGIMIIKMWFKICPQALNKSRLNSDKILNLINRKMNGSKIRIFSSKYYRIKNSSYNSFMIIKLKQNFTRKIIMILVIYHFNKLLNYKIMIVLYGSSNLEVTVNSWLQVVRIMFYEFGRCKHLSPKYNIKNENKRKDTVGRIFHSCHIKFRYSSPDHSKNGTTFISLIYSRSIGVPKTHPHHTCSLWVLIVL